MLSIGVRRCVAFFLGEGENGQRNCSFAMPRCSPSSMLAVFRCLCAIKAALDVRTVDGEAVSHFQLRQREQVIRNFAVRPRNVSFTGQSWLLMMMIQAWWMGRSSAVGA